MGTPISASDNVNDPAVRQMLIARALEGARAATGEAAVADPMFYPRPMRLLAGAALFRANLMTAKAACRDLGLGASVALAPSQLLRAHVDESGISALVGVLIGERQGAQRTAPSKAPAPPPARRPRSAKAQRAGKPHTATLRRFASADIDPTQAVDLAPDNPALADGRTIFPSTVVGTMDSPRFLVSGHNNPKLGKQVTKGPRTGWPIFQITLEERATCPRSCPVWAGCYGNAMPFARRHRVDEGFMAALRGEIVTVARQHPQGLLIRLHTLGDFFSVAYVLMWAELLAQLPQLHVFGYTARRVDDADPDTRKIASAIALLTQSMWGRFAIRTSHAEFGPQRSVVVNAYPGLDDVIVCPAQTQASEACATCGLCWAHAARGKTIAFLKHGMTSRGQRGRRKAETGSLEADGNAGPPAPTTEAEETARPAADSASTCEAPVPVPVPVPALELAPELAQSLDDLPLEVIGERLGLDRPAAEPEFQPSARRRAADALLEVMLRLANHDGVLKMFRANICSIAGVNVNSWRYLTEVLFDSGRMKIVRAGKPQTYRVSREPMAIEVGAEPVAGAGPCNEMAPAPKRRKAPAFIAPDRSVRLKRVGEDIVRWCRFYLAAGVALDFLAFCFDVDEERLAEAVTA